MSTDVDTARAPYTPRAVIEETKAKILAFVTLAPAAPRTIAKSLGIDVRIASYCARALAKVGALTAEGNRSARVYVVNPDYVPVAPTKITRTGGPRTKSRPVEAAILAFLSEHAASANVGIIAEALANSDLGLTVDHKAVGYHCRTLARAGMLQYSGDRRARVYTAE